MSSTSPASPIHELSNAHYRLRLTESGGGQSIWTWIALNRWPADSVEDSVGFFLYLRDLDDGSLWSATRQPTDSVPAAYAVDATATRIVIDRRQRDIDTRLSVSLYGEQPEELRELLLHNRSDRPRRIEITSYVEIALAHPTGDLVHPAFSKLFVQTALVGNHHTLIAQRRPRGHGETWPTVFHRLEGAPVHSWETDRLRFIGRGRSLAKPAALSGTEALSNTVGNVLDPVLSLRTVVDLAPGEQRNLLFTLGIRENPAELGEPVSSPSQSANSDIQHRVRSGFNEDGSEYSIEVPWTGDGLALPPMPWINVIANERFGFIASETGAGACWSRNSQANRLTPWSNDPVCDPHGEAYYLRDEDSGEYWSPLPGPAPSPTTHLAHHGFGYSRYESHWRELMQTVTMFVARHDPVKIITIRIANHGDQPRQLSLFGYQQLVLGTLPDPGAIRTERRGAVLCAVNTKATDSASDLAGGIAFCYAVGTQLHAQSLSCDRRSFIGTDGSLRAPRALSQPALDGCCTSPEPNPDFDACFARQFSFALAPNDAVEFSFVLGEAGSEADYTRLTGKYIDTAAITGAFSEVVEFWDEHLGRLRVTTPSPAIDYMVNGWLPYQALSCRIWGRTAYYQSSGAYGYRDQMQDAHNLALLWPELTREQLLLNAAHQFSEGDVLHWWHAEPIERGLRTRFSDDLLWLPFAAAAYLRATGDASVLNAAAPFLRGPALAASEDELYQKPELADIGDLYSHCIRALDRSLTRGAHGLPLMGTGDWNDGMNRVGREGRGESVWLGFFLADILKDFIPLATQRGDHERATRYADYRDALVQRLNADADDDFGGGWDGSWYRRAYYDDGTPLGTHSGDECRIDGLVQAWAVLTGIAPPERAAQAMDALDAQLVRDADGLICLLTPPFVNTPHDPGYIRGYVAGVRENGGQYTHASCWMIAAFAKLGRRDRAAHLLERISPLWHSRDAAAIEQYKVEPYVIAADIYGAVPHVGRGGWTWYTGSAGWAWRVAVESILGLRMENGTELVLEPCVPDDWGHYTLNYQIPGSQTRYCIDVRNPSGCTAAVVALTVDGTSLAFTQSGDRSIAKWPIVDDGGVHQVRVVLGAAAT